MITHHVAFWNLENFFAPQDHPDRPDWLQRRVGRDLRGWDEALFRRKAAQLSRVIAAMNGGAGPDILGVCEVENAFALQTLVETLRPLLPNRAYAVVHADSARDRRGIDTAFLYDAARYDAPGETVFSHFVMRRTGTRDILQATFHTERGARLVAMSNHWPSRSGGAAESAGFRATAGETAAYFHERIREELGADAPLIVMGDLNDDPWDPSVVFNANATRERGDVARSRSARLYNLSWRWLRTRADDWRGRARDLFGTLYFQGDGHVFDQILINRSLLSGAGGLRVLEDTAGLAAPSFMVSASVGEGPLRFGLPDGNAARNVDPDGFSDHFPVAVTLREG
jgi:endonuclease/exonuclease/phosphatase family metal-dependent hydrolase